jgi:lipopolysaccharide export system protein LptA
VVGVVVVGTGVVVVVGTVVVAAGTVVVVAGTVVVVTDTVVVVVDGGGSSRTAADAPPARANPTRKRRARPLRLTAKV